MGLNSLELELESLSAGLRAKTFRRVCVRNSTVCKQTQVINKSYSLKGLVEASQVVQLGLEFVEM